MFVNIIMSFRLTKQELQKIQRKLSKSGSGMKGDGLKDVVGSVGDFLVKAVKTGFEGIGSIASGITGVLSDIGIKPSDAFAILGELSNLTRLKKYSKYLKAAAAASKSLEAANASEKAAKKKKEEEAAKKKKGEGFPDSLAEPNAARRKAKPGFGQSGLAGEDKNDGSKDVIPVKPVNSNTSKGANRGAMSGWAPIGQSPNANSFASVNF